MISLMWNRKYAANELIYKTEIDSQTLKINLWLPKGGEGKGKLKSMRLADINDHI